jgi:RNA polymerase sigma factor (sigma-70 family)
MRPDSAAAYACLIGLDEKPDTGVPDQEERLLSRESRERLHQRIGELPDNYRDVVLAYYFEELSYQEIADRQRVQVKTVESKLYRACQWIRRH